MGFRMTSSIRQTLRHFGQRQFALQENSNQKSKKKGSISSPSPHERKITYIDEHGNIISWCILYVWYEPDPDRDARSHDYLEHSKVINTENLK